MSDKKPMIDEDKRAADDAVAKELDGVPADMIDEAGDAADASGENLSEALAMMKSELDAAKQEVLYARAETENVRRRMEKDAADARAYAATGFARDVLSVSDNLSRAIEAVPADLQDDERLKGLVAGIAATQRELEKVFGQHGITRVASIGLPLDPNQHQAMLEVPSDSHEPGTVVQEMQSGWMIKDRLLRPAMVAVAKKP
ncbi:nucleotide exchange factor GrpE [Altererythrobacter aerius]|uniref:Protein GrpE n=1 Tax=Tsuneonella aeria TaxID=1837929 RepID=A0A6I4TC26_9SPHN|nr:nucleotide exchange factor GrpE [Tsuneonella aeria]MXO73795.1 nucleotide exchange factor GrpE [Tsuneonella aeria]